MDVADDSELIAGSLAGNREAFAGIVARYQSLICSLAFSATGSLAKSEDVAQETFLAAWRQLKDLREPGKLRSWLCGIARNLVSQTVRQEARELTQDSAGEPAAGPQEQLISREEQAILWRSLEQIPEQYREPLVLLYREHQSGAAVAGSLELIEETVRQRLSRGRKLLHEQVLLFVEGALARSTPDKAFTLAVMGSLPAPATLGAATVNAGVAKIAGVPILGLLFGPLIGVASSWLNVRAGLDVARTQAEKAALVKRVGKIFAGTLLFTAALWALALSRFFWDRHPQAFVLVSAAGSLGWAGWLTASVAAGTREARRLRPPEQRDRFEYRSTATLFGLPLVHIRQTPGGARGIVAVGDRAVGVIAIGELSAGLFSLGAVSIGVISVGGVSVGGAALGGFALGAFAFGGSALGFIASGGLALGWHAAVGGLAAARDLAAGGLALAAHENDPTALDYFRSWGAINLMLLLFIAVAAIVPSVLLARRARRIASQE